MTFRRSILRRSLQWSRGFSSTEARKEIRDIRELPDRIHPRYLESKNNDLLSLQWPAPPRNVLLTKKDNTPSVTESLVEYAKHIASTYPTVSLILESHAAEETHESFNFPVYTTSSPAASNLCGKVDLISTLGGDGTILHAASLFASSPRVPPILSFSMGTLGFLGEWKFKEYKRAFREVYMSGAGVDHLAGDELRGTEQPGDERRMDDKERFGRENVSGAEGISPAVTEELKDHNASSDTTLSGWSSIRGKSMGAGRGARVLLRNRLKVGIFAPDGSRISSATAEEGDMYAMNEVLLHRGRDPHLAIVDVFVGGRFLTEAVADGMIISTPTGSTAYSLSSGGSIVHPLVSSLLLTPVCPRSLSFRPLVLPANTPITLRLSEKNRGRDVEVSVDGVRKTEGLGVGMELRVHGEDVRNNDREWLFGVPSVVRGATGHSDSLGGEDHWVGGLNSLLKFNYPFGEDN